MHGSMGGERNQASVGHAARHQAPLAYPTSPPLAMAWLRVSVPSRGRIRDSWVRSLTDGSRA